MKIASREIAAGYYLYMELIIKTSETLSSVPVQEGQRVGYSYFLR